ncbi:hypothetical protein [Collinsella sp. AF38-3AC]|uniref:hypothetical protein n=1 Tax=Collinsella sp. AF38-3AC TaxID=2292015 RepID=UPI0011C2193F|nr:hypothetical protein [Collinsella sp. AF38-3AC]
MGREAAGALPYLRRLPCRRRFRACPRLGFAGDGLECDEAGIWACGDDIQERGSLNDAHDTGTLAEGLAGASGAAAMIPYNVFEEVVDVHDTNYLIALAICIDQLPDCVTADEVSRRIRLNADQDMDERRGLTVREQDEPSVSLDELAEVYGNQAEPDEVEVALER